MSKVVLYSTKRRIALTHSGTSAPNWNLPMHNPDFRAYKGAQTDVEFLVRNIDRKPIALTTELLPGIDMDVELVGTIIDHRAGTVLFQKPLTIVSATRGIARLTLTAVDLMELNTGFLSYTIGVREPTGGVHLLYVDQYEQARGFFEVMDGALPIIKPSVEVQGNQFTPIHGTNGLTFVSSAFPAVSVFGVITVALYLRDFSGTFLLEGNLNDSAEQDDNSWFNLQLGGQDRLKFDHHTGTQAHSVESRVNWIRFRYEPDRTNAGAVHKVLFRN